jgi:CHASE2 domain-containing sensor protein
MPSIFISYRRDDDPAYARLLYEHLKTWFPGDSVFMDVEEIDPGANWRSVLTERIRACDVVIALIGRHWLDAANPDGSRRLDDPQDFVRWEISEAFKYRKRVIPVLLSPTTLPGREHLPGELAPLADLQYLPLAHASFDQDLEALAAHIAGRQGWWIRLTDMLTRFGKTGAVVGAGVLAFGWINLFDLAGLDTRTASFTMLAGDVLFEPRLSNALLLAAIRPGPQETERLATTRRADYARLIDLASRQGAKAVVFDITASEASASDSVLQAAIMRARKLGTAVVFAFTDLDGEEPRASPAIREAGAALGFACVGEKLGEAMLGTLALQTRDRAYPSLALEAVYQPRALGHIKDGSDFLSFTRPSGEPDAIRFSTREVTTRLSRSCPAKTAGSVITRLIVPISHRERLREPTRQVSLDTLLSDPPPGLLAGKLILVGAEHPFDRLFTRLDVGDTPRYGFEFQADAINALLTNQVVYPLGFGTQWLISAGMIGLAAAYRLWRLGKPRALDCIVLPLACLLYLGVAIILYAKFRLLMDGLYHLAAFLVTWWAMGALERRWRHEKT